MDTVFTCSAVIGGTLLVCQFLLMLLGMDGHEWPYLVTNNMFGWKTALTAQAGMVFSDEPGIYIRGEFGVRLEDDMYLTSDGARLFTPQSASLEQPF